MYETPDGYLYQLISDSDEIAQTKKVAGLEYIYIYMV